MKNSNKILSTLIIAILLCCATTASTYAAQGSSWYVRRNGNLRPDFPGDAETISEYGCYYVDTSLTDTSEEKRIYLTFDVGYENGNVSKILDVMREEGVVGAFFILENLITQNPELVRRMYNEGHLVCNHTAHHKDLSRCDTTTVCNELTILSEAYYSLIGEQMPKYFRFPEGKYSVESVKAVNDLGYKSVFWSFGYEDWDNARQPSEDYAIRKILTNTHNGAVILLHPTSATNAAIMRRLISEWRNMGYSFGTLDELTAKH